MRKVLVVMVVLALAAVPAMAFIPGAAPVPGPAVPAWAGPAPAGVVIPAGPAFIQQHPSGWAVLIETRNTATPGGQSTFPVWLVCPGSNAAQTAAHVKAANIARNINFAAMVNGNGTNLLADMAVVGNIGFESVGGGNYSVYVWGVNMWAPAGAAATVKNHLAMVDSSMAKLYGASAYTVARFLKFRLQGMAAFPNGTQSMKNALNGAWNSLDP